MFKKKTKKIYILGIETSCDETAAAVIVADKNKIEAELSSVISSQIEIHRKYGGVIPEVAARKHVESIIPVIEEALIKANVKRQDLDAIAVTSGPGLITSLTSGIETAKTLSLAWNIPLIPINHIEGHIYANFLNNVDDIKYPSVILTVSGGHTILLKMDKRRKISILGQTRDDAAGEAFDKGAKMLGLNYPGGPEISKQAEIYKIKGEFDNEIKFPRPMINSNDLDFSFSGLKTALLYELNKDPKWKNKIPAYSYYYQQAIIDVLISKTLKAAKIHKAKSIMLTGGVSANSELKKQFIHIINDKYGGDINFISPEMLHSTDNASMIAVSGFYKYQKKKKWNYKDVIANPSDELI